MRYIIFSDLHSNLEALEQFEKEIATITYDKLVCLGDIVGYGADPNACVEWVIKNVDICIAGNHDWAAVELTDTTYFNYSAYESCLWTRNQLKESHKEFLRSLPLDLEEGGIYWVHSSPYHPKAWHYITSKAGAKRNFESFSAYICFVGHSHKTLILEETGDGEVKEHSSGSWNIDPECRYIFNDGSLGQPRDRNPDPAFMIYDSEENTVKIHRFKYDLNSAQGKIRDSGLPLDSAERLSHGR
ncbi:MAG: metallophosphoesterase family protein [Nitrospinae bacterium]|nr:metallophosphoesterase family protein [Nitrospinota bacterium]